MVKSKKMSKTSIAVIVLAFLMVFSMIMTLTGAWFTARNATTPQDVNFKFGNVTMGISAETRVSNDEDGDNVWFEEGEINNIEKDGSNVYELIAGSRIITGITLTNTSTVDAYYVLKSTKLNGYYLIDATAKKLIPATNANLQKLAQGEGKSFNMMYQVAVIANGDESENHVDQTETAHIFQVYVGNEEYADWGEVDAVNPEAPAAAIWSDIATESGYYTYAEDVLEYDASVSLGALLVSGTFQLRAVQADNMTMAEAYSYLTTDANYADITPAP